MMEDNRDARLYVDIIVETSHTTHKWLSCYHGDCDDVVFNCPTYGSLLQKVGIPLCDPLIF